MGKNMCLLISDLALYLQSFNRRENHRGNSPHIYEISISGRTVRIAALTSRSSAAFFTS